MALYASIYIFILLALIYVLLFGSSEFHRTGIVGRINFFLTFGIWDLLMRILQIICPQKIYNCIDYTFFACFNKRNPILMIFYFILVGGGYVIFLIYGSHLVPGPFLSRYHLYFFHLFVWSVLFWFLHVCFSNPGVVNTTNYGTHLTKYHFDGVLYQKKTCGTCTIIRPARSKHCRICNRCVARFDHHCAWINSDVGAENLWKFLVFLFSTGAVCQYCAYLCYSALYGVVIGEKLLVHQVRLPDGSIGRIPLAYIIQFLAYYHGPLLGLGAFCGLISLVLYGFFLYHCYLVARNITTNESFRWDDKKAYVKKRERLNMIIKKEKQNGKLSKNAIAAEEWLAKNPPLTAANLINTYNHGIVSNFSEVFFYKNWKAPNNKTK